MSPEPNEPCTCGGGKKHTMCRQTVRTELDPITLNREVAYTGEIGRRRRQFCLDYTVYKKAALARGESMLQANVAAQGETISCKKGCAKCCSLYVTATLQEAECITYYLYQHESVLQHFITAYRDWKRRLGLFDHKRVDQALARNLAGNLGAKEQERLSLDVSDYSRRNVRCPFLIDNVCSIYEVRPFVCAGVVAVTPTEMCTFHIAGINQAKYHRIDFNLVQEMPYFIPSRIPIVFGCMPELIHRLLAQGYSFLASIEGLEELLR
jgi:Fe-S-cluster containining protein